MDYFITLNDKSIDAIGEAVEKPITVIEGLKEDIADLEQTVAEKQAIIDAFPEIVSKNITANGTYSEEGKAYSPVVVNVTPTEPTLVKINKQSIKLNKTGYTATKCSVLSSVGSMNVTGVSSTGIPVEYALTRSGTSDAGSILAFMYTDVPTSEQWYPDTHNSYVVADRESISGYWAVKLHCSNTTKVTDIPTQTITVD